MLGTWMRIKYPHILDGMVAGSAPIWSYLGEVRACFFWQQIHAKSTALYRIDECPMLLRALTLAHPAQEPTYDSGSYAKIVTRDASKEGGSAPACSANVRKARSQSCCTSSKSLHA